MASGILGLATGGSQYQFCKCVSYENGQVTSTLGTYEVKVGTDCRSFCNKKHGKASNGNGFSRLGENLRKLW